MEKKIDSNCVEELVNEKELCDVKETEAKNEVCQSEDAGELHESNIEKDSIVIHREEEKELKTQTLSSNKNPEPVEEVEDDFIIDSAESDLRKDEDASTDNELPKDPETTEEEIGKTEIKYNPVTDRSVGMLWIKVGLYLIITLIAIISVLYLYILDIL